MLFDGKRNRVLTKVVAIVAVAAFLGVGLLAGGLALSGGCSGNASPAQQAVESARGLIAQAQKASTTAQKARAASPGNAQARKDAESARSDLANAWDDLALALATANANDPAAIQAAAKAVRLAPDDLDKVLSLVTLYTNQNNPGAALPALQAFTRNHPRDAQAFAYWGQVAEQAGKKNQAILAYQRFLQMAPDDTLAPDIQAQLDALTGRTPAATTSTSTGSKTTKSTAPAVPATP